VFPQDGLDAAKSTSATYESAANGVMRDHLSDGKGSISPAETTESVVLQVFRKPSDELEPSTPSLPWRFWGGNGGHGRALAATIFLQIASSRCVLSVRACPRVPDLMYPSRTRGVLSVLKTVNELGGEKCAPVLS
jgi:hypothetical protein